MKKAEKKQTAVMRFEDLPELPTPEAAQAFLRVSRNGIYELLKSAAVPSFKFGRLIRIKKAVLLEGGR